MISDEKLVRMAILNCNTSIRRWEKWKESQPDSDLKAWADEMIETFRRERDSIIKEFEDER